MSNFKWFIVVFINLAIALGFYYDGSKATVGDISSDLANIIPVCIKLDDPNKFQNDLYLNEINNVKYYTPAFVQLLRANAKVFGNDYIAGLNLLAGITHFLYGFLWFLFFFTLRKDFWLSLIFSIFFRGIIWPPGGELFGIADLWTIMPRTVFIALAPIPYLLYYYLKSYRLFFAGLSLGLILNFHPISGVGLAASYFAFYFYYTFSSANCRSKSMLQELVISLSALILGMLPYLLTYFLNVKGGAFDQNLYDMAFHKRLGYTFSDPFVFIAEWHRPILYFFLVLFLIFYFFDTSAKKVIFKSLAFSAIFVFISANTSVYIESLINNILNLNLRLSFQLIRYQKFILILFQIGAFLLFVEVFRKLQIGDKWKQGILVVFVILSSFSYVPPISKLPLIGDDLVSSILPNCFMVKPRIDYSKKSDLSTMLDYIKFNTEPEAIFYGSFYIRAGAERSVVLDGKGASMIIEGNQPQFIKWYVQTENLQKLESSLDKVQYLRSLGVDYILSKDDYDVQIVKTVGVLKLYKL